MNSIHSLYIHIPFCDKICDYCDFAKLQYFRNFAIDYLKALKDELESYHVSNLKTIYVGGGTPTALEDDLFLELLEMIDPYKKGVKEYTFEANPESLSLNKIKMLKEHGVNRISLGVQTTNDKILKAINRDHSFTQVKEAIKRVARLTLDFPEISELDINPIFVYEEGSSALDIKIKL
jgi:oxygen-independent coproporphyrinogen-3 oxidase